MAQITEQGVTLTTLPEYKANITTAYQDIDPNWNISPETPDGMLIAAWSEHLANLDEQVSLAYQSVDPDTAVGAQLDRIALVVGIERQRATASSVLLTFKGAEGTQIPAGTEARGSADGYIWRTNTDTTIENGSASVVAECQTSGAIYAAPNTIKTIYTPIGGIRSVTNEDAASPGTDRESDEAFRARRNIAVANPGNNQLDSMNAAVGNVIGVNNFRIYENQESGTDENGVAGHSLAIFVDGGSDDDVLAAIASRKNPGCGLNRNSDFPNQITDEVVTSGGNSLPITFFRPQYVTAYVHVRINSGTMTAEEQATIKSEILKYADDGFGQTTGFAKRGFQIGQNVPMGPLYTPVNYVLRGQGYIEALTIGRSDSDQGSIMNVGFNELAVFDEDTISIEVV
ncbi:hypothetical protein R84981_002905 [Carnimonas sp. R-84981]|uniref:baseplate J/gp47 family protein n=1 Tax=Carnimonas bestiolae TaxID=3402172 RepID=UPI003EDC22F6